MSQRVPSPSVCRTGTRYLPKQTSLLLHFGFNLTGSSMPTPVAVCYFLTHVWETDPAWKVTAFVSLLLHHPFSCCCCREALPQHPARSTDGLALLPRTPNMGLLKELQAGTQHIGITTHLQWVTTAWAVPIDAHTVPSASTNHAHEHLTKATCKTLSETPDTPLPPCLLQPAQEEKCLYLCGICMTSYCSQQEVFSGLQEKDIWAGRGSTAMADGRWMLLPTQAKPNQALRCQTTEEGSRVAACPIHLRIKPRTRWNCLAPLQPSWAQSPASAWSWNSAQTTSCVSLSVAKITCKQTKNHLKLSFPARPDLPARLHFKGSLM